MQDAMLRRVSSFRRAGNITHRQSFALVCHIKSHPESLYQAENQITISPFRQISMKEILRKGTIKI